MLVKSNNSANIQPQSNICGGSRKGSDDIVGQLSALRNVSLIAYDMFSTRSKTNYHVSASASTQKTIRSLWGSPERTTTLVPSPIFGITVFPPAIGSAGAYALHGRGRLIEDL